MSNLEDEHGSVVDARVLAISVGVGAPLDIGGASPERVVESAIRKRPVSTTDNPVEIEIGRLGLAGDEQADLSLHGGLEKAVYMYPVEHYDWWRQKRHEANADGADVPLAFGAMGENLTTTGLLEEELWVGDRVVIGRVVLRVEAPRGAAHTLLQVQCDYGLQACGYRYVAQRIRRCLFERGRDRPCRCRISDSDRPRLSQEIDCRLAGVAP
ncbi:hypothetical protein LMG28614_01430 [Paraburkholderia ultramafica]|uniref:MOSC domain-containing protein n=1 Tax=Paraburkholderia ultramafica TaxID=1544867 RepID=A0A6S7AZ87_9BURK|nr:hypothetical protein LMG28614_01430 [Paraburkholderia ultramafica]